jgi:general secretion pathway protein L
MHILAIDIGTYSIKYISSIVDKRKVSHQDMSEIVLREFLEDHPGMPENEASAEIVKDIILSNIRSDTRVIYQIDNELLTNRFLTLPVKSKKKAELMLPFQLEEDIPFSLGEIHYTYRLEQIKNQYYALVGLLRENLFESYYNLQKERETLPNILTTEASAVENFFNLNAIAGPFCVLDIGHKTTKAYFFYNSRLIVTHMSYMGGQDINEMISQSYKIGPDEAIIYKHQNAFLLTSGQYRDVDEAQREFALAMDKTFNTLINDFARWKIGLKVNYGLSIQHVFLMGGSANIKNISNFLTEKWDTKVVLLETFDSVESTKIDLNPKNKSKYALVNMMTFGMKRKNRFLNLLTGKFAQASSAEIPLHSLAFIATRSMAIAFVLLISLLVERFFIESEIAKTNAKLTSVTKNEVLSISGRLRRGILSNPKPVMDSLVKKQKSIRQEISTLQSAMQIKALSPLAVISTLAATSQVMMTEFSSNTQGEIKASFSAEALEELSQLKLQLERSPLNDVNVEIDSAKLQLNLTAVDT